MTFKGRTAVVTGASNGLGRNVAHQLVAAGARVIGFDIEPAPPDAPFECRHVDMSDPSSIDAAIGDLDTPVGVLCNVAGLPQTKPAIDVIRVNVLGLRHLTESLAPKMAAGASVVHVASMAGNRWAARVPVLRDLLTTPDFAAGLAWTEDHIADQGDPYIFAKEAIVYYTKWRSHGLFREHGVRMNCVSPGEMDTRMMIDFRIAAGDKGIDGIANASTVGRMADPSEVAHGVVFLASDAAGFCFGTNLLIDGGWTALTETDQVDYSTFA